MPEALQAHAMWGYALAAWAGAGGAVGAALGWWGRNRFWRGALLGMALGPLGWWLLWRGDGAFGECAGCSRTVRVQARTCPHCGISLSRAEGRSTRSQLKGVERARGRW